MPVTHLNDFSDRFSPMLVKELRQGLRAKTFLVVFLSLQVFLAVMMFSATATSSSDQVGDVVSGIIFGFFAVAVLLVQPLRGISALSSEVKSNTLDMMALTRLSSAKIVIGKWVAIVSQTALLLSTIVPYLILRYFFGGMNLFGELVMLALLFLTSIALTAVTVGLSGCSSVIIRSLLPIFGLPALLWSLLMVLSFGMRGVGFSDFFSLADNTARVSVALYVVCITYVGVSMLSLGASLIAPAAENHSVWRRLFALVAMLVVIPLCYFDVVDEGWHAMLVFVIAAPAIVIALSESAPLVSTVCEPFVKRGPIGKAVGLLFYPTWPSGVLFAVLLGVLGLAAIFVHPMIRVSGSWGKDETTVTLAFMGSLFFPAVWQAFLFRGDGQRIAHYLLLLVGSYVMLGILHMLADAMNSADFLWFFAWHPLSFIAMVDEGKSPDMVYLTWAAVVDALLMTVLVVQALLLFLKNSAVIEETENILQSR
ncbi:MAG: hypothetical protein EOP88_01635 [Verrucomicrobiaceae bacterium]|nr:MAG: hypothetical protein EOP88_01635 [Verrucomicrobiaceae bacterium]